jgi:hypothetical protein
MFLRNVGIYLQVHTALQPRRTTSNKKLNDWLRAWQSGTVPGGTWILFLCHRVGLTQLPTTWVPGDSFPEGKAAGADGNIASPSSVAVMYVSRYSGHDMIVKLYRASIQSTKHTINDDVRKETVKISRRSRRKFMLTENQQQKYYTESLHCLS